MGTGRPKKAEILKRRADVTRLALNRITQQGIAEQLGVSQTTVHRDLKVVMEEWKSEYLGDMDLIKVREIVECEEMEREVILQMLNGKIKREKGVELRLKLKERKARYMGLDAAIRTKDETPGAGDFRLALLGAIEKVKGIDS